jgi:trehalose-phosphatase
MSQPLFDARDEVAARIRLAPRCLLCLDFDGTLAEFVGDPADARMSPEMDRALRSVTQRDSLTLAIVSGRDRADLERRVGLGGVIYAGNHGLDIAGPGLEFLEPMAVARVDKMHELAEVLSGRLQGVRNAIVEDKGLTISVHYRMVDECDREELRRIVHATLASADHPYVLVAGDKVHEIRPRVAWNKGSAVVWIREHLGEPAPLPIYVGDDATDEDAFAALREQGISVKVRTGSETAARYTLDGPIQVCGFLEWIDDLLAQRCLV